MVRTFQLTKALNRMTVMENMRLGATAQPGENLFAALVPAVWRPREKAITEQAEELLARFKLDTKRDDFAGSLSGGQRKLLEMARALMAKPQMIMLDEPMAGVNPALTQSLLGHIQALRDDGMTVLFVEHDMHMVRHISDWVIVMTEGRIVAEGPPDSVMNNPAVDRRVPRCAPRHRPRRRRPAGRRRARAAAHRGGGGTMSDETMDAVTRDDHGTPATASGSTSVAVGDRSGLHRGAPEGEPLLAATDLVAGYLPGVNILNGCDLVLHPGELIGIIGPNGAGKSTLLKALFGLVNVRSGSVTLAGEDITNLRADHLVQRGRRASSRRTTTCSPRSPSRRTCRWACSRRRGSSPSGSSSSPTCSRRSRSGAGSAPARCRVVSGRWSRWPARS